MKFPVQFKVADILTLMALVLPVVLFPNWGFSQSSTSPICHGSSIQLQCTGGTVSGCGITGANYSWTGPYGYTSNDQNPTINLGDLSYPPNPASPQANVYTLTISGGVATSMGAVTVTINTSPEPVITGTAALCPGTSGVVYFTDTGLAPYSWLLPSGGSIIGLTNTSSVTVNWGTLPGTYTLSVTYTPITASGCTASRTIKQIEVWPSPTPSNTGPANVCNGTTVTYTTDAGMSNYVWTVSSGYSSLSGANTRILTVTWGSEGTHTVGVTYNSVNNCPALVPNIKTITVNPTPTPTITGATVVCRGQDITYYTEAGMALYQWNVGPDGQITSGSGSRTITVKWSTSGTNPTSSVTVNYTNPSGGCSGVQATVKTITVNTAASPTITGPASACIGSTGNVYYTESGMTGYTWTVVGGTETGGSLTSTSVTVTWPNSGVQTVSVNYTLPSTGCTAAAATVKSVTVNPSPTVNSLTSLAACNGATTSPVTFSGAVAGTVYSWTNSNTSIGLAASGTGTITSFAAINTGTSPVTATITVTPAYTNAGTTCTGIPGSFTITVYPTPTVTAISNQTWCSGAAVSETTVTGPLAGTTFNWTNNNTAIGLSATGIGNIPAFTATNTATTSITGLITITPTANGCIGTPFSYTVTVYPGATVNAISNQAWCNGVTVPITTVSGPVSGTTFSWTNNNTNVGLAASGTGNVPSFTATNATTSPINALVTINPTANGCPGTSSTYTITVNPTPTVTAVSNQIYCVGITSTPTTLTGTVAGTSFDWTNNNTAIGLTATGTTVIPVFTTTNGTSSPINGLITITPAANGCSGPVSTFTITINPGATVNPIGSQTWCNGVAVPVTTVNGPVSGTTFTWINSNTSIGLAASGTGNIGTFTATNSTAAPITAQITITPTANSCAGTTSTYTITVNPTPTVTPITNQIWCAGTVVTATSVSGSVTGTTFNWTNSNTSIGLSANGTGNIPSFTATNASGSPVNALVTITPFANGCAGPASIYTITVNPAPIVNTIINQTYCNGASASSTTISGPVAGTTFTWTNNNTAIGLGSSGTGNIPSFAASNTATATINAQVTVTPAANGCIGTPSVYTITVNPTPNVNAIANQIWCNGTTVSATAITGLVSGTTFTWSNNNTAIGLPASGTGSSVPSFVATNNTGTPITAIISIIPSASTCIGPVSVYTITVNPTPTPTITGTGTICPGSTGVVYFTETGKFDYTWTVSSGGTITAGTGTNAITITWLSSGNQTITVNYSNSSGGCQSPNPTVKTVTVVPATAAPITSSPSTYCTANTIYYTAEPGMTMYQWTVSAGGTIVSVNNNVAEVIWNTPGAQSIQVSYINAGNCLTVGTKTMTVNASPVITISGDAETCLNTTDVYATQTGKSVYLWTVSTGGTITSGLGTSTITVLWTTVGNKSVSVNYTNPDGGCTLAQPVSKSVTVYTTVPVITGPAFACAGGTGVDFYTSPGMTNYVWSVSAGGSIVTSPTSSTGTVTVVWNATGLQTVYVNYTDNHGCSAVTPSFYNLSVNARPSIPVISGLTTACVGSTNTYTTLAGMSNYSWNVSSGGTILTSPTTSTNTILVRWNTAPVQTLQVNYTNGAGCMAVIPGTLTCTVNLPDNPGLTGPVTTCVNASGNTYATETGKTNYIWTISPGGIITSGGTSTSTTAMVTWTTPGLKTITVNYSNLSGCVSSTPGVFTTTANPVPDVNPVTGQVVCNGSPITQVTFTGSVPGTIYQWTNSNSSIGLAASGVGNLGSAIVSNTGASPAIATITVTPYYTNLSVTCTGSAATFTIIVNPTPTVNSVSNQMVSNGILTAPINFTGSVPGTDFNWTNSTPSIGLSASGSGNIGTFTATNNGTTPLTATVTVTPAYTNGGTTCTGTPVIFTITVYPQFIPGSATASQTICANSLPAVLVATSPTGGIPPYSYEWQSSPDSFVFSSIPGATDMTYQPGALTTTTWYRQSQTASVGGTLYTNSVTITVNPLPVPTITGNSTACAGSTANNYVTQSGMSNYLWSILPGTGTITGGQGTNAISVTWSSGTQILMVNYTNGSGCTAQSPGTYTVTVYPQMTAGAVTASQTLCYLATPVALNATSPTGGDLPYTFIWQSATDNINFNNIPGATSMTYQPGPMSVATWYRQAQTSAGVCGTVNTDAVKITVNPLPIPTIAGQTTACINSTGNIYFTETGMSSYIWTVSPGGTITAGQGTNTITVTWSVQGTMNVTVNYTNIFNCTATAPASFTVTVNAIPTITGTTPNSRCDAGTVVLGATSSAGTINWYAAATGGVSLGTGTSFTTPVISSTTIYYVDATLGTCTSPARTAVTATINVTPSITGTTPAARCGPGVLILGASASTGTINWYSASTGGSSLGTGASFTTPSISGTTVYYVDVTSGLCTSARTAVIATINPIPAITGTTPAARCDAGTVTLLATASAGTINWYAASTGGTILGSGNSFITPVLSVTTTYYVDATLNTCTTAARTAIIATVNITPSIVTTTPAARCGPGTVTLGASASAGTINWYAASTGGTSLNTGGTYTTPVISASTTYYVDATSGSCTSSPRSSVIATINPLPVPTITGAATACLSSTGNIYYTETGMNGYSWSVDGGIIDGGSGTNSITLTWTSTGTRTITVNYTVPGTGCTSAGATLKTITVYSLPQPSITGPAAICVNTTGNIYSTEAGMTGYSWNVTGGTIVGPANTMTISVTWTTAGTNLITVNYFNSNGCSALLPAVRTVTVQSNIIPQIIGPDPSCVGGIVNYTTDGGMSNYNWTISTGGTIISGQASSTLAVTWTSPGSRSLSVIYNDPLGCASTVPAVKTVVVYTSPTPTIIGTAAICQGSNGVVYFTESGKSGYVWTITPGGVITSGQGTNVISVNWIIPGIQTITVNYANASGCNAVNATAKNVVVYASASPTIAGQVVICNGNTYTYTTEPGMLNYEWQLGSGGTIISGSNSNVITVLWTTVGIHTITVAYLNSVTNCPTTVPTSLSVLVNPSPLPTISGADTVCLNGTVVFSTEPGNALYNWAISSGGLITSGVGTSSIAVKWTQPGIRTVTVNYTNTSNCSATQPAVMTIVVYAPPVPVISGLNYACSGGSEYVYSTTAGLTNYDWNVSSGGTITTGAGTNSITVAWTATGVQTVTLSYTDIHGCNTVTPSQFAVTVNPRPLPTITGTSTACVGSTNNTYATQTGMTAYSWNVSAGGTILTSPTTSASTITVVWNTSGLKTISVNYTNAKNCDAVIPATFTCTVNDLPVPTVNGPVSVCVNSTSNLYRTESGKSNYTWTISPGGIITAGGTATSDSIQISWITAGTKTVSVNYANAFQCMAAVPGALSITVNSLPVPAIIGPAASCRNTTTNVYATEPSMTNYVWTVSGGGIITSGQGTQTITVTWTLAGTETITVNYKNSFGCGAATPTVKVITVNPLPVPAIAGNPDGCVSFNSTFTTENGMSNYLWSVSPGGTIISGTNSPTVTINWNSVGQQTVTLIYTNLNGCTATPYAKTITVHDFVLPAISGPVQGCTGIPVTYSTEAGMTGYSWTLSTSGVIVSGSGTQTISVIWYSPGTMTVTVNYINAFGCTAVSPGSKTITVSNSPVPWINGITTVCQGTTGVIYSTTEGMQNYQWNVSTGGIITSGSGTSTITVTWTLPGLQTVTVNYTDPSGCAAATASAKTVTVSPTPVPTITGPSDVCSGSSVVYFTETGMSGYLWNISPGGVITSGSTSNLVTVDWTGAGAQSITVVYTDPLGCVAAVASLKTVTVNPLPIPTITNDTIACLNGTTTFITEPGMSAYQWTVSTGGTIVAGAGTRSIVVSWLSAGTKTITVSYLSAAGCYPAQLTAKPIVVSGLPVPVITGPALACIGSAGNLYNTAAGMSNYIWTVSAGGIITAGAGTNSVSVTWTTLTPQVISVNYTSAAGCSAAVPTQYAVSVTPLPVTTLTGTSVTCAGSTSNVYITEPGMTNYQWTVSTGGTILTNPSTGASTITVVWTVPGIQTVGVSYTNAIGCTTAAPATKTVLVKVSPLPVIAGPASICAGTTGVVYSTDPGNFNYAWTITPGGVITGGNGTNQVTVSWLTSGTQTLTVNYANSGGCPSAIPGIKSVTVNSLPVPGITGSSTSCINGTTTYTTEAGMTGYTWTVSAGGIILSGGGSSSIQVQWTSFGLKTVSVSYTSANGCTAAMPSVKTVTVYALPVPTISGSAVVCTGATGVVYATEGGMNNYAWIVTSGGVITSGTGTNMITITWNTPGTQGVSVSYTNAYGCAAIVPTNLPVSVNSAPVPTITGSNQVCVNSGNYAYSTEPGMTSYLWTVPTGGIIVSGQGTPSIQINWSVAGIQTVSVGYTSPAGCIAIPTTMNVTVKGLPDAHGPISGDTLICKPRNGVVYSIAPIPNATGYVWNVPVFANIVSGANTNIITVNYGSATQSGNVSVFGTNSCGNGPFTPMLPVGVYPVPETPHVTVHPPDTLVSSAATGNQWYREFVAIPGATGQTYIATNIGRYFVIVNPHGCISDTSNVIFMFPVGLEEGDAPVVKIYPNPANDRVTLSLSTTGHEELLSVSLVNNLGQESLILSDYKFKGEVTTILELGNPPNGIYHLVLQFGNHKVIRKLIVINE